MKRNMIIPVLILVLLSLPHSANGQTNERWLQDYEAMKTYMSEAYANLEWAKYSKKLDLAALDKKTTERLRSARSDIESRIILDDFLEAFEDGHLSLREENQNSKETGDQTRVFDKNSDAYTVCKDLGFKFKFHRFSMPFGKEPVYELISSFGDPFPTAVFELENGKRFGLLRIGLFSSDAYLGICTMSWQEFQTGLSAECRSDCIRQFQTYTEDRLSAVLAGIIRKLQDRKLDGLIVDIAGNGGGTNWVEPVARMLSPKPLSSTRFGFIRHPHWVGILRKNLNDVLEDLEKKDLTDNQRRYLTTAKSSLERSIQDAKTSCNRTDLWEPVAKKKNCTLLSSRPMYASGVFEHLPTGEIGNLKSKTVLFNPSANKYEESIFKGNLFVLVDRKTASASEYFVSMIQANRSGTVVGEKTFGAGCGYVNGGTRYFLPNSKLRLRMPDCVRYRSDGVNEVEGIEPDISLWDEGDDETKRLSKLMSYLSSSK